MVNLCPAKTLNSSRDLSEVGKDVEGFHGPANSDEGYFGGSWCDGHSDVPMSSSSFVSLRKTSCIYFSALDPDKGMTKYILLWLQIAYFMITVREGIL